MITAKVFKHGGSQAVRLPKDFRFTGSEVIIEKRGNEVVLRPAGGARMTLAAVARELREKFPVAAGWPERNQPKQQQQRKLDW